MDFSQDDNLIHINYRLYQNKFLLVTSQGVEERKGTSSCCTSWSRLTYPVVYTFKGKEMYYVLLQKLWLEYCMHFVN